MPGVLGQRPTIDQFGSRLGQRAFVESGKFFIKLATDRADHDVLRGADLLNPLGAGGKPTLELRRGQRKAVKTVDCIEIDRYRHLNAIYFSQHPVLVRPPFGKLGQVIEDGLAVGMEYMRAVLMDQNSRLIITIIGIAPNMGSTIDDQHLFVALARQPFGDDASGKSGTNHEPIKHEPIRSRIAR